MGRRRAMLRTGGLLGIENKFLDTYASAVAIPAPTDCSGGEIQPEGGCTNCLSAPAQGDGPSNRDGKKIIATSIFLTGCLSYTAQNDIANVYPAPTVFVALVQDTQTNGTAINSEDVFTNPNDTPVVNAFPLRNLENSTRFKVLAHKTIAPGQMSFTNDQANAANSTTCMEVNEKPFILTWKGTMPIRFDANTTADIANVVDNSVSLIAFCTSTTQTIPVVISFNCRMRFQG